MIHNFRELIVHNQKHFEDVNLLDYFIYDDFHFQEFLIKNCFAESSDGIDFTDIKRILLIDDEEHEFNFTPSEYNPYNHQLGEFENVYYSINLYTEKGLELGFNQGSWYEAINSLQNRIETKCKDIFNSHGHGGVLHDMEELAQSLSHHTKEQINLFRNPKKPFMSIFRSKAECLLGEMLSVSYNNLFITLNGLHEFENGIAFKLLTSPNDTFFRNFFKLLCKRACLSDSINEWHDLKQAFTEKIPAKKLIWQQDWTYLSALIKFLKVEGYIAIQGKYYQKHWESTINCFLNVNNQKFSKGTLSTGCHKLPIEIKIDIKNLF